MESFLSALKEQWSQLLCEGQELTFKEGQVLFYEGHIAYGLFVLQSGHLRFMHGKRACKEDHLLSFPEGQVITPHHFSEGTPYYCTCTAASDCRLVFLSKTQLLPLKEPQGPVQSAHQ